MKAKIHWRNLAPGAPRDEAGYWQSSEGRFLITPCYRSTVYPSHYELKDKVKNTTAWFETVRGCKVTAADICKAEFEVWN